MSPAEMRCLCEYMGLSAKWLAARWGVTDYSVQRWERNRILPDSLAQDLADLEVEFNQIVAREIERRADVILVPRTDDEALEGKPAAWWRAIAHRVREDTDAMIVYYSDDVRVDHEPQA
ncbi:hypothetical protein BOCO_0328 [Bombiscardovia coagulans]|uniref:Uncharacterized protein n=1 Tax=Bombiscardovia coagulans TaxID=686666 RepID=A0A261ESI0_9BIFI|nr:hypothetical protein BOCO_0328 [Bombiscardovia coagulans]